MKLFDVTDIWSGGIYLLLTLVLLIFVILVSYFNWKIAAVIAGIILVVGIALMIYITIKSPDE